MKIISIRNQRLTIELINDLMNIHGRKWIEDTLFEEMKVTYTDITLDEIREGLKVLDEDSTDN